MSLAIAAAVTTTVGNCPPVAPSPAWKNDLTVPTDSFEGQVLSSGLAGWVKFTIRTCEPGVVVYQDGNTYAFHHDFATNELEPFVGLSVSEYEAVTLHAAGRQAFLGAVLTPPTTNTEGFPIAVPPEYGVQLVSTDPLSAQEVLDAIDAVRTGVAAAPGTQVFYFPTFEQQATALTQAALLEANGILIGSPARWSDDDSIYSAGWAVGRLVHLPSDQIEDAFLNGALLPTDVLLTDGIPAGVPLVAGMLTLAPSTPSSHAAILAQTFGVPFVHIADPTQASRAQALVNRNVLVRAYPPNDPYGNPTGVRLFDLDLQLDLATVDQLADLKLPPPLDIAPTTSFGGYSTNVDLLALDDIRYFGGKAANFSMLRSAIPGDSPVATALSFDLWNEFLDQTLRSGNSLRTEIDTVLVQHTYPPANMQLFSTQMDAIRDWFKDDEVTSFTPAQESAIVAILSDPQYNFDVNQKIRFRSSTNMEDGDRFTGAGLYDSKSGCLPDDLDGDETGPSLCNPDQDSERGVYRAIRRVYASFYNDNAVLERLRHNVAESSVGMGILVHHSFPDEFELANGVATFTQNFQAHEITIVTQDGAVSVSNPDGEGLPEVVSIVIQPFTDDVVTLLEGSTLVQLGDTVMEWQQDYLDLRDLILAVAVEFEQRTGQSTYVLDLEFKKLAPGGAAVPAGGLVVKQVRQIPQPDTTPSVTPFLLNEPYEWGTLQGESGSVLSNNRLKARLRIETRNTFLTPRSLQAGLHTNFSLTWSDGCSTFQESGSLSDLDGYTHVYEPRFGGRTEDSWNDVGGAVARRLTLQVPGIPTLFAPARCPILVQEDLGFGMRVLSSTFADPVLTSLAFGTVYDTTDFTLLSENFIPPGPPEFGAPELTDPVTFVLGQAEIRSRFVMQSLNPCTFICAGQTAVMHHFEGTVITGLTTQPIVLESEFSQTFRAGHHNFVDYFLFVPRLEPGLPLSIRAELDAKDIYAIYVEASSLLALGGGPVESYSILSESEVGPACGELFDPDLDIPPGTYSPFPRGDGKSAEQEH
jgi:hypothetical protein